MKTCNTCQQRKTAEDFHRRSDNGGLRSSCIQCSKDSRQKACVSCGTEFVPNGRHASRCAECYPLYRQAYNIHKAARHRAEKKGIPFDITVDWITERCRLPCPRTGVPFAILQGAGGYGNRGPNGPSLDQITPSGGYTTDNVQVVSWWYNCAKQRFSDEEVLALCKAVVKTAS